MSRGNTSAFDTETEQSTVYPVRFIELDFTSPLRLWSGIGDFTWDSKTWTGAGDMLDFGETTETADIRANGKTFALSGVPATLISLALNEDYQGNAVRSWFGLLDDTGAVIADPVRDFKGSMDVMSFSEDGEQATIMLEAENSLVALERPNTHYYTAERQKLDYPGDKGFDQVNELQEVAIDWGKS